MSIFQRISVVARAHVNDLVDKVIDENSIPVVTQFIRDLETTLSDSKHAAAMAAANVTTLSRQRTDLQNLINQNTLRATAFKTAGNEAAARALVATILQNKDEVTALDNQITTATTASQQMDAAVEKVQSRHDAMVRQLRTLQTQDRSAHALAGMTKSLKAASAMTDSIDNSHSVDNLAQRIQSHQDEATEEFNRTVADFAPTTADPLQAAAEDDFFKSLGAAPAAQAATAGQ